jgi:TrmH family RNA methyltransferase
VFLVEGQREIGLALAGGYLMKKLLYAPQIASEEEVESIKTKVLPSVECISISSEIYAKLAYRSTTEGMIAIFETRDLSVDKLDSDFKKPLILVAEAPEKPGNIGALLRTADAAKVDLVLIANPKTDVYNPNIVRSSVGTVFTTSVATGTTEEILKFLTKNKISIYCAALQASEPYHTQNYKESTAIVVGTEATGLSESWLTNSTQNIIIPMSGQIDSMNVSVDAGILIFEAKRQRGFN